MRRIFAEVSSIIGGWEKRALEGEGEAAGHKPCARRLPRCRRRRSCRWRWSSSRSRCRRCRPPGRPARPDPEPVGAARWRAGWALQAPQWGVGPPRRHFRLQTRPCRGPGAGIWPGQQLVWMACLALDPVSSVVMQMGHKNGK